MSPAVSQRPAATSQLLPDSKQPPGLHWAEAKDLAQAARLLGWGGATDKLGEVLGEGPAGVGSDPLHWTTMGSIPSAAL